jgi:hypothetical protein
MNDEPARQGRTQDRGETSDSSALAPAKPATAPAPAQPSADRTGGPASDGKADSDTRSREAAAGSPGPTGISRDDAVGGTPRPAPRPATQPTGRDEVALDARGAAEDEVGNDNIREGRVGGVQGPHHGSRGQGQGG